MAYENMTYEVILQRMIDRVTKKYPNLDTREGSMIFDALAPAAIEMAVMYVELDNAINESFVDTASREYLLIGCDQVGIDISTFEASGGVHLGKFNVEVTIGSRWNCDLYNYEVIEFVEQDDEGNYVYRMKCETTGTAPNNLTGVLTPITEAPNDLTVAELFECIIEGENETSDENIKQAYHDHVKNLKSDGNVTQYKAWCDEYDGIGNYRVFPLWNGANTVKVSILNVSNKAASEELVAEFQEYLDPNTEGMGNGVAPIGAFVTVTTATEVPIDVSATLNMKDGYSETEPVKKAIADYFASISYEKNVVAYMNVGATLINAPGVEFVNNLVINGGATDITLGDEEIPVVGTVTLVVSE